MKKILILSIALLINLLVSGQILKPVKWSYGSKKIDQHNAVIFFKAEIENGWHIYSVNQPDGGPSKTSFTFNRSNAYEVIGNLIEPIPIRSFEKTFMINVFYFEGSVVFQQKIK